MQKFRIGNAGLLFLIFNLAAIPILGLLMQPLFVLVYSGEPGTANFTLSLIYMALLLATNVGLALWAWRTEPVRWVARAIAVWTGVTFVTAFLMGAVSPWAIARSLILLGKMIG